MASNTPPHRIPQQLIGHFCDQKVSLTFHGVLLYRPVVFSRGRSRVRESEREEGREREKEAVSKDTTDRAPRRVMGSRSPSPPRP